MSIRDYPDVPRIYLDMDGVVADFEKAMVEHRLTASQYKLLPGSYVNLEPIPGAIDGINQIIEHGLFVMLLTKIPSENPYAASEKMLWMRKYLPFLEDHIIISPDKGCIGSERDTLVDDFPEWANAHNFRGNIIQFGSSPKGKTLDGIHQWAKDWESLVSLIKENYASLT